MDFSDVWGVRKQIFRAFRLPKAAAANANKPNLKPVPRAILVKFRWLTNRDRVMKAARKNKSLQFKENRVMFFPDLSAEIQQQRRMFDGVKARLHNLDIEFGLQFPAKMRIYLKGKPRTFLTDVEAFIQKIEKERSQSERNNDVSHRSYLNRGNIQTHLKDQRDCTPIQSLTLLVALSLLAIDQYHSSSTLIFSLVSPSSF
ncbi:hypothetical protein F2P81_024037 [Scophthalmus maximus]|uniref:Uncharacterized protein n=1 Tax=Scophthalmus maximus TaxID=52904 RepID=A0A6A4RSX8_SCOMX|nr:hypothetical protein F2P81_024037 [Scophthalmus maximus]